MPMQLPAERPGQSAPADLAQRRAGLAAAIAAGMGRSDPPGQESWFRGVRALCFEPPVNPRGTLIHLHGGAFRIGCPEQIAPFAAALAARCGVRVVCPAYRLAPEHPFPAALNDAHMVLTVLAGDGPVLLSGDSAGGGLAASLALLAHRDEIAIAGLALLSPWLDLTVSAPAYVTNAATDSLFSAESARIAAALYLQGHSAHDALASPLFGSAGHLPPVYVDVGDGEVLLDDARALHARVEGANLNIVPGMEHVAATRSLELPGAARSFEGLAHFIDDRLSDRID